MRRNDCLAILLVFGFGAVDAAHATSRFTVKNESEQRVKVYIFDGDDGDCTFKKGVVFSEKTVQPSKKRSYGCEGSGKDRCKVTLLEPRNLTRICKDSLNTCNGTAMIMHDGATVTVTGEYKTDSKGNTYYEQSCEVSKKVKDTAQ